jgi:hypothetical protein
MARTVESSKGSKGIPAVFARAARAGRVQLGEAELVKAGVPRASLARAVRSGALRKGSAGYWIPAAGDPGAALIFRNALSENHAREED